MKLWKLSPADTHYSRHWTPWFDKSFGFMIRAESEEDARQLAAGRAGDEGPTAWTDPVASHCVELNAVGNTEIVMIDFHAA